MESRYNILWFDDDFMPVKQPEDPGYNETVNARRIAFHKEVGAAPRYGLNVTGVYNLEQFTSAVAKIETYQAVIFDLRGLDADDVFNDDVVDDAMEMISKFKDLLVYVYSANESDSSFRATVKKIREKGNCFYKGKEIREIYEKILNDLDSNLHYYQKHSECLDLINNGFLGTNVRSVMDRILSRECDETYIPYNDMRKILEEMITHLRDVDCFHLPVGKTNHCVKHITEYFERVEKDGKKETDYSKPLVPYEICSVQIKKILSSLWDIVNVDSHNDNIDYKYLLEGESNIVYLSMQKQMVYMSFYIIMKWYYGIMYHQSQQDSPAV